jgi:hypothetical protein
MVQVAQEFLQVLQEQQSPALAVEEDLILIPQAQEVLDKATVAVVATAHRVLAMVVVLA